MKKIILTIALFCLVVVYADQGGSQKFQVTYSITFNSITLGEAAAWEKKMGELFKDACKIEVDVEKVVVDDSGYISTIPQMGVYGWGDSSRQLPMQIDPFIVW